MNAQRLLLHSIALAALTVVSGFVVWFAREEWRKAHQPSSPVIHVAGAPIGPDANGTAVNNAVRAYYMVYGKWPDSWKRVKSSLIFQRQLTSLDSKKIPIDPDDGIMNFPGDVVYQPGVKPAITSTSNGRPFTMYPSAPLPFKDSLPIKEKRQQQQATTDWKSWHDPALAFKADKFLASEERLIQLAIIWQLQRLTTHTGGKALPNLKALLRQPTSPIDSSSINPVTKVPFTFDGSVNDVLVMFGNQGPLTLAPVLEDGKHPTHGFIQ